MVVAIRAGVSEHFIGRVPAEKISEIAITVNVRIV
jgi:hypothetical protein